MLNRYGFALAFCNRLHRQHDSKQALFRHQVDRLTEGFAENILPRGPKGGGARFPESHLNRGKKNPAAAGFFLT